MEEQKPQLEPPTPVVAASPPHPPTAIPAAGAESLKQYGVALANAAAIFGAFSAYLLYRRGYYDLYIANKALANTAAILFGVLLLLGPLGKYFKAFDRYLKYRKELGMVGAAIALAHVVASYFFLRDHFPLERFYTTGRIPFAFGLAATLLLVVLVVISNRPMMHLFGGKLWWQLQHWGVRLMFVAVALHVGIMKWSGWVKWYREGGGTPSAALKNPWLPGAGLLVGWFIGFVLLQRTADLIHAKLGRAVWYLGCIALPAIYLFTFWWGLRFRP